MKNKPKIEILKTDSLIPYARNSRTHSEAQVAQIAGSIREFGFTNPVLIDGENGIIAGHGRIMAAQKLGLAEVPCIRLDHLTETQRKAYVIADNKLALNSGWDDSMLALELAELQDDNFDLSLTGFDESELADLLAETIEGETDPDEVPDPPANPVTVIGDVWILGRHRILCGDSTVIGSVEKILDGSQVDLCFTSPPYALGKNASLSNNKKISERGGAYDEHEDDSDSWDDLMAGWWSACQSFVSSFVVNIQPLAGNKRQLFRWINDRIDRLVDVATWDKGHAAPAMAKGVMSSRYEWLLIFGENNASRVVPFSSWRGTVQSVYNAPPQRNNEFSNIHGATMPSHLAEWACGILCDKSKTIYDPFGGTGTTLIACEKLGKTSKLIELTPIYVDVAVKRWQDFTGKQAIHEASGKTFDEMKEQQES
jgi:DNA modification methylase